MKTVKDWLLNNILSIISCIPILVAFFSWLIKICSKQSFSLSLIFIICLCVETFLVLYVRIWRCVSYKAYRYPASHIKFKYLILKKEISYKYESSDDSLTVKNKLTIKSLEENLNSISGKYFWTGNSKMEYPQYDEGVREISPETQTVELWHKYHIILSHPVARHDSCSFTLIYPKTYNASSSRSYVSTSTEVPIKELIFKLQLGEKYAGREVTLEEYRSMECTYYFSSETCLLDHKGEATIKKTKLKRFRYYILKWKWLDTPLEQN